MILERERFVFCFFLFFNGERKEGFFFFLMWIILFVGLRSLLNLLQYCFSFMFWFFNSEVCGISAPLRGLEPILSALEGDVPNTGPPGESQEDLLRYCLVAIFFRLWRKIS